MAISTQGFNIAKRHAKSSARVFGFNSSLDQALSALFQELSQKKQAPDLQVIEVLQNGTSNVVLADAACKLYGLFLTAPTTADSFQAADHASSAASPTIVEPLAIADQLAVFYATGHAYANGITCNGLNAGANFKGIAIIGKP